MVCLPLSSPLTFKRSTKGISLTRNFNITALLLSVDVIEFVWVAKGVQKQNTVLINGSVVGFAIDTNPDGPFNKQTIALDVFGILTEESNTLTIESVESGHLHDIDDFKFVLLGMQIP